MTGEELKAISDKLTQDEAWDGIIRTLKATGLSHQQIGEVMRVVAIYATTVYVRSSKDMLSGVTEALSCSTQAQN